MKSILVFIDGTICDTQHRHHLRDTPDFYSRESILADQLVPGSTECLVKLAEQYEIVYIGSRPSYTLIDTEEWLEINRFPEGFLFLAEYQDERLEMVRQLSGRHDFIAGIGDRWDDNVLHTELGCLSIILREYRGDWENVSRRICHYHQQLKVSENRTRLTGKVEGLARVCTLLFSQYSEDLWGVYHRAVKDMAERTREARRFEDLALFDQYGLDPADLRDAAKLDEILREANWENNPVFGLQNFELMEAKPDRYVHKVTRCLYAELWKEQGKPEMGYQIHCRSDEAWWDHPAWNPEVRFEQPETLMKGSPACIFIQYLLKK